MAFRTFEDAAFSRRSLLRGGAWLGAGAALSAMPMGRMAFAHAGHWPAVVGLVDKYTTTNKLANMVAVMGWGQKDPDVIAQGTLELGKVPVADIDSLYRIYSMTKPITGMAAMMLIGDGKLGLDQPLAEILPAFANMQVQKEYDGSIGEENLEPAESLITIRHLLTHTAGLGYGIIQKGAIKDEYEDRGLIPGQVSRMPIPGLGRGKPVSSLEAFADGLAEMPLVYQPGTMWSYSVSLDLLGRVIEVVSGMPFDEFLTERIFKPAGMDSTWFTVPDSEKSRLTTNYGVLNGMSLPIDPGASSIYLDNPAFPFGGAGLVCSPRDYDRFQRMLLNYGKIDGKRVMSELVVRVGTSNLLPSTIDTTGTFADGAGFGAGGRVGLGDQAGTFGWGGAAGTVALVNMKLGLRASVFTQYMPSDAYPIHSEFPAAVLSDLAAMQGA
ncbi:serine hydrolase domain-containing protein [Pontixanthobacter gangjinensis]|uniref:Serine hydrolase n=1 Tax=Pontixanthobacter gangjinensis TaxID=1028742 RepID=A0A6I4SLH1_9SPHN|nr:serine hydrolase domain-containing protein [Pontixanthobacter gangjinensis]MXO56563.1 serine hydrolase [Pontixanthobacter gangjinensis]